MKELEMPLGIQLDDAMQQLYETAKDGNAYYAEFGDRRINSNMSIDEAYITVTGMNRVNFKDFQKRELEKMETRKENRIKMGQWLSKLK